MLLKVTATQLLAFCLSSVTAADSTFVRPTTAGVALAYPKTAVVRLSSDMFGQVPYQIAVPVDLQVSRTGTVSGFSLIHVGDSLLRPIIDSALRLISFVPGSRDSSDIDQSIPGRLLLKPAMKSVLPDFALGENATVGLAAEYAYALATNGVFSPRVSQLGSYAYPNHLHATPQYLPSIVAKVVLSKSGRPRSIDIIHSTMPGLDDQIRAVLNWATFEISPVQSIAPLGEFYAAIVLHPAARYPTAKLTGKSLASLGSIERFLFQLLPDTLGLLIPPLPRDLHCDSVAVAEAAGKYYGRLAVNVAVDTLGAITIEQMSRLERPVVALVGSAFVQMRFYPALQFDGRPREFRGLVHLDFEGSTNVRVHVDWLRDRASEPIR